MIKTPLCTLLGVEHPILQGGMAWIADARLAAAVSNAGGLGVISSVNTDIKWVRDQIGKARMLTDRPFGVNIMLQHPLAAEVAELVAREQVPVVITGAGSPVRYMDRWHGAGILVLPVVASVRMARSVERAGAAAVIAEGCESGGHIGELTTMALVPQVCDSVGLPVVAAGGIADGRQLAAALMLGAQGVQMGTRFLTAVECGVHPGYKRRLLEAGDTDTVITGLRLGHVVRSLKSSFSLRYLAMERDCSVPNEELEAFGVGALRRASLEGDGENGCFLAGQVAGMLNSEQPAAEIIAQLLSQADDVLAGAGRLSGR